MKCPQFHNQMSYLWSDYDLILNNPTSNHLLVSAVRSLCASLCMHVGELNGASLDCQNKKKREVKVTQAKAQNTQDTRWSLILWLQDFKLFVLFKLFLCFNMFYCINIFLVFHIHICIIFSAAATVSPWGSLKFYLVKSN